MTQINLTFKNKLIESYAINDGMTIGSDPTCDIHIDSLAVQPHHAQLKRDGDDVVISKLDDAEIKINGQKAEIQLLKNGDLIQIGKHTLDFINLPTIASVAGGSEDELDDDMFKTTSKKQEAFLQVLNGNNVGKTITLTKNMTNLGKSGVQTAIIARREDGYFLSHLEGDTYPTVNKKSIGDSSYELKSGDSIKIGNVKLLFSLS